LLRRSCNPAVLVQELQAASSRDGRWSNMQIYRELMQWFDQDRISGKKWLGRCKSPSPCTDPFDAFSVFSLSSLTRGSVYGHCVGLRQDGQGMLRQDIRSISNAPCSTTESTTNAHQELASNPFFLVTEACCWSKEDDREVLVGWKKEEHPFASTEKCSRTSSATANRRSRLRGRFFCGAREFEQWQQQPK
jgi:hypothetical protein